MPNGRSSTRSRRGQKWCGRCFPRFGIQASAQQIEDGCCQNQQTALNLPKTGEVNVSIEQSLAILSERVRSNSSAMATEEAVKTAVVLPFFHALGYDVFNPNEMVPEFTADAVGKKGEKVDYAIKLDNEIRILVECKPITTNLDKVHLAQLFRYFTVTMVSVGLYEGRFTSAIRDQFTALVKAAFRDVIRDSVATRLSTALAVTEQAHEDPVVETEEEIVTTEEEREGYMIVKAIAREVVKSSRIFMRDARSYCAVLIDNNNRKPLARLHFNRSIKYLGLFDGEKEERLKIDSLDQIYDYSDRIRATASRYAEEKATALTPNAT